MFVNERISIVRVTKIKLGIFNYSSGFFLTLFEKPNFNFNLLLFFLFCTRNNDKKHTLRINEK